MIRVHQLLSGAGPHDAITTEALAFRALFAAWGWGGADHAYRIAPGLGGGIAPAERLRADPGDVLLLHHSAGWPRLGELLALPNRKLLLYHNVTPPGLLWEHAPVVAAHCAAGREQLAELVAAVDVAAADSAFNAAELTQLGAERPEVIPLLIALDALGPGRDGSAPDPPAPPTVMFVGRLSPHKGQEPLIRAFAQYRRHRAPEARLSLVGDPISAGYEQFLRRLADTLAPGAVSIESGLPAGELGGRYRAAHVFACLSEHEGFCIPLLEAFHFGVPVIARAAGAVPEVLGDAGILVEDRDPAVIAELLHLVAGDVELRTELRRRAQRRLGRYEPGPIGERLRAAVEATLAA
ncbi:MAG TPA: glycosyltransferase family 4 protein [Solirubrobacteraceae bacterium]|nr:glycosyltransferase family 4 protein [Solirubrobacteraceae bacterium]